MSPAEVLRLSDTLCGSSVSKLHYHGQGCNDYFPQGEGVFLRLKFV